MVKQQSLSLANWFQPSQIVGLEHQETCLYAEVIQVVTSRQICWVRPLLLAVGMADEEALPTRTIVSDLRLSADLLWPASLFRPALDTEVLPLLAQLNAPNTPQANSLEASKRLNHFIHQVWQAHKSEFQAS
jgi:hypothetical protein